MRLSQLLQGVCRVPISAVGADLVPLPLSGSFSNCDGAAELAPRMDSVCIHRIHSGKRSLLKRWIGRHFAGSIFRTDFILKFLVILIKLL